MKTRIVAEAYDYFKQGGPETAGRFLARYDKALRTIMANPTALDW